MSNILVLDPTFYVRSRIKEIANKMNMDMLEATNSQQLFTYLQNNTKIDLIITETRIGSEDGFEIIKRLNKMKITIPIIILTSENKRASFIKGIQLGASDYILKPFDDDFLTKRIIEHMNTSRDVQKGITQSRGIFVNVYNYIEKEVYKASKGKYPLSLMMVLFHKRTSGYDQNNESDYISVGKVLYPKLSEIIFESDVFIKYGSQTFIGVFPFCGVENQNIIKSKFDDTYNMLKQTDSKLSNFNLITEFVEYPADGQDRELLFDKLVDKVKMRVSSDHLLLEDDAII